MKISVDSKNTVCNPTPVVYVIGRSKAAVRVLSIFCVCLWTICFPCICLFILHAILFVFSFPRGVVGRLRLVIVALPGLFI